MKKMMSLLLLMTYLLTLPACAVSADPENSLEAEPLQSSLTLSQGLPFADIPRGVWYEEAVRYCYENNIMNGTSGTAFAPERTVSRAMLATVLHRIQGSPAPVNGPVFSDTQPGAWYSTAVAWASETGIISGYGNGVFGIGDPVTREQAVTILWRSAGAPAAGTAPAFTDEAGIAAWAEAAAQWAGEESMIHETADNRFGPKESVSRGEAAFMLFHWLSKTDSSADTRVLVAYFSATNTTRPLAEDAASITGAELYEILPERPYTSDDLNYNSGSSRANREQNDPTARPAIAGRVEDMEDYDVIFLGYPIWHGQAPRIISTFLESYDFTGKTIVPFCTSHSSGIGSSDTNLHALPPGANWLEGRRFAGGASRETIEDWISELTLPEGRLQKEQAEMTEMNIQIGDSRFTAALEDNAAVDALIELLRQGPVTIRMQDYSGFEKVGPLGTSLPAANRQITTRSGDIVLYNGDQIVFFYGSNSWSYTPLAHVDDLTGWTEALGRGDVTVTLSLDSGAQVNGGFDFDTGRVILNSGYEMPINGLGTYSLHGETCINSVKAALSSGVRLIDTASAYGNEEEVGQAIREAIREGTIRREDIFVITKIYPGSEMADPERSIQACLDRLDIGYVDMMLLHHPDRNDVKAYKAMERFVENGKIHSIGLSNWYVEELKAFLPQVDTVPALVQNEIHPYYQENDVIPYIQDLGIVVQGWYPLGGRGRTAELLGDPVISAIAQAHGVSSAQVILRWNLQKGVVVIPGSSNPDHIRENTELYHFALTDEEMARINALDRGEKHDWY